MIYLRVNQGATSWGSGYNDGELHHLGLACPASATLADCYVVLDGSSLGNGSGTRAINTGNASSDLRICQGDQTSLPSTHYFLGSVDDACVWSTDLSVSQFQDIYNSKLNGFCRQIESDSLEMNLTLDDIANGDDGDGDTFRDQSGNDRDGTGENGPTGSANGILSYP